MKPKYRRPAQSETYTSPTSAGTSTNGPTTAASASPDQQYVAGATDDAIALHREHEHDRIEQADERERPHPRNEHALVPRIAAPGHERATRQVSCEERNAEEDQHALRDRPHR